MAAATALSSQIQPLPLHPYFSMDTTKALENAKYSQQLYNTLSKVCIIVTPLLLAGALVGAYFYSPPTMLVVGVFVPGFLSLNDQFLVSRFRQMADTSERESTILSKINEKKAALLELPEATIRDKLADIDVVTQPSLPVTAYIPVLARYEAYFELYGLRRAQIEADITAKQCDLRKIDLIQSLYTGLTRISTENLPIADIDKCCDSFIPRINDSGIQADDITFFRNKINSIKTDINPKQRATAVIQEIQATEIPLESRQSLQEYVVALQNHLEFSILPMKVTCASLIALLHNPYALDQQISPTLLPQEATLRAFCEWRGLSSPFILTPDGTTLPFQDVADDRISPIYLHDLMFRR